MSYSNSSLVLVTDAGVSAQEIEKRTANLWWFARGAYVHDIERGLRTVLYPIRGFRPAHVLDLAAESSSALAGVDAWLGISNSDFDPVARRWQPESGTCAPVEAEPAWDLDWTYSPPLKGQQGPRGSLILNCYRSETLALPLPGPVQALGRTFWVRWERFEGRFRPRLVARGREVAAREWHTARDHGCVSLEWATGVRGRRFRTPIRLLFDLRTSRPPKYPRRHGR